MTDKTEQHRYLFTVRQQFGQVPVIDTFYELQVPAGITGDQAQVMTKLNNEWCKEEIAADTAALSGIRLRLRFNSDMFQKVCMVRVDAGITADELECIIQSKHTQGALIDFLDESAI